MANSFTTNYNLTKPEEGGANDTWGGLINTNLTTIDSQIYRKVDKADNKGVTHSLTFSGNNITTGTARGFEHIIAGDRIYIANASTETEGSGTSLVYRNRGEFYVDTVVNDTELTLDRADGTSAGSFASETISSVVSLVTIPPFTRQGLTQLAGEIKLYASVSESVIQALGSDTVAGNSRYFWLTCNGQAVSRSTYNSLFKVVGTSFGTGDGSSTFNVPDFRGRTPIGTGTGVGDASSDADGSSAPSGTALTARDLGEWGGRETFTLAEGNLPTHVHAQSAHQHDFSDTDAVAAHTHSAVGRTSTIAYNASGKQFYIEYGAAALTETTEPGGAHTVSISGTTTDMTAANTSDGGFANDTLTFQQRAVPFLCVNYIIAT
tara:strand:- start:64 stop:1197 length:1134 start_codon:yes stop_codon:yes gene_type:complete